MGCQRSVGAVIAVAVVLAGCAGNGYRHENTPDNLKGLVQAIRKAAAEDPKTAVAMTKALLPDEARLRKCLKDDVGADVVQKILSGYAALTADDDQVAKAFAVDATRSEIQVHPATTEQLKAHDASSPDAREFPGGALALAEQVLRPGVTFYEVEFLRPGSDTGMKYHLFYWDGSRWTMLGPAWRFLR